MMCGAADEGSAALFVWGGEGLDSPGGRIGVSLLTGAKFGDRMKKIFSEFFVLDFMRTEKFREDIV